MSGSSSEADSDLAVHGDEGGDTDIPSSFNNNTCDSLSETEEGRYCLYTEYLWLTRLHSYLINFNQKGLDGTSDNHASLLSDLSLQGAKVITSVMFSAIIYSNMI